MNLFAQLIRFELYYQLRQPAFVVTTLLLFAAGFFATASVDIQRARGITTAVNGPYAITMTHLVLSIMAMFMVGHFAGRVATRDRSHGMDMLILATQASSQARFWSQLMGAIAVSLLAFVAVSAGSALGAFWPEVAQQNKTPFQLSAYGWAYVVFVVPNLCFCAVMLYALARIVRSIMGMYLGLVAFFVAYEVSSTLLDNPRWRTLGALLDPFGFSAFAEATRYWTASEKNTLLVPFEGLLQLNRLIWLGVAAGSLALFLTKHNERREIVTKSPRSGNIPSSMPKGGNLEAPQKGLTLPAGAQRFLTRTRLEVAQLVGSPSFLILSLLTSFMLVAALMAGDSHYGTSSWPLTRMLSENIQSALSLLILIVLSYYAAEAVWRERQAGIAPLIDTTPVASVLLYLPKLVGLWCVIVGLATVGVVISTIYQTISGYPEYQWFVYLQTLALQYLLPAMFIAVLSLLMQILSPNKYVGMLLFAAFVISSLVLPNLGFEHHLWRYSEGPEAIYSDMNGLGHFLPGLISYHFYWAAVAAVLGCVGCYLWPRGTGQKLKLRLRAVKHRMGLPERVAMGLLAVAVGASGANIFYNTNVLNRYEDTDAVLDRRADYERTLKHFEPLPVPTIKSVQIEVDLYPERRRIAARGHYQLRNERDGPISEILVSWAQGNDVSFEVEGGRIETEFESINAARVSFSKPMRPGEQRTLTFSVERATRGFRESQIDNRVVENGTFINNQELLPRIGYDSDQEVPDNRERDRRGLGERAGLAPVEDTTQQWRTYLGPDVQPVHLESTLSTAGSQIAIAPGRLVREWRVGDRRFFRYQTEVPVFNFFALLSGNYQVKKTRHNDVAIEVYHHPVHDMNVDRMIQAVKDGLDYFGSQFSPYTYRQLRIVEFPRYARFAQSFANTIPYSEDIGFVADLRKASSIDYVYFVTAHELAHQWWGHQLAPANVQGGTVLSESLAQYSALTLVRERYGDAYLRRFLKWELDRYLRGRSNDLDKEQVLMRTDNKPYIHYQKGGLVLYGLQELMGVDALHGALRELLTKFSKPGSRYATTRDLLDRLNVYSDEAAQQYIHQAFERITLYDLSVTSAMGQKLPTGKYQIDLTLRANKIDATHGDSPSPMPMDEDIDVALLKVHPDAPLTSDDVVQVSSHRFHQQEFDLTLLSDHQVAYVTVDPFLKRIDRDTEDNTLAVTWREGSATDQSP